MPDRDDYRSLFAEYFDARCPDCQNSRWVVENGVARRCHCFTEVDMLVSTSILLEYEEILRQEHTPVTVEYFLEFLRTSDNIVMVNPTFRFQLPFADEDDQKFVDCGVCGNADFLITNDRHFRILQHIAFPRLQVIAAESFMQRFLRL